MTENDFPTRCFRCKGPYHPATGDFDRKWNIAFCGPCYRAFLTWMKGHVKRKWGKCNFYEEAATSIKAE